MSQEQKKKTDRPPATLAKARSIGVVGFVEARAFEINSLQRTLDDARNSGNARAFQTLPRHLRRRAASHNVKRIPARLRARALEEMKKSAASSSSSAKLTNHKAACRYKRRRTRSVREEYELRQSGKRWLETHVWHAKRMHMQHLWGTMIATTPNERSHRAAYRAAKERCYAHDVSYFTTLEIAGHEQQVLGCLVALTAPGALTPALRCYSSGARMAPLTLYRAGRYPCGVLGPASALWKPQTDLGTQRVLWLRVHPSLAADVFAELEAAASRAIAASSASAGNDSGLIGLQVQDVSCDLVSFELLGTSSTPLLAAILSQTASDCASSRTLQAIASANSPAVIPEGAVMALRIHDPRLSFPIKFDAASFSSPDPSLLDPVLSAWPEDAASLQPGDSGVFDRERCASDLERRHSEHQLNQRRREQLVPGTKLEPGPNDVTVPLLLVRTGPEAGLGSRIAGFDRQFVDSMAHGWTLIGPRGWGMALWMSLVFAGARAQGMQERLHLSLEAGQPAFPRDWPGSPAYDETASAAAADALAYWQRRPPGKRTNYAHHGIESPFFAPFHQLLGMPGAPASYPQLGPAGLECRMRRLRKIGGKSSPANADADADADATQPQDPVDSADIWLVSGEQMANAVQKLLLSVPSAQEPALEQWALPLAELAGSSSSSDDLAVLFRRCLVRVRLVCNARGVPDNNSPVCLTTLPTEPIGYVTAGSFSLARGCGMAIAACSLCGLFALWRATAGSSRKHVLIRSMNGSPACEATLSLSSY
ncbi:Ribonucleases P/MRP protein subunit pop1 [Coemansia asiatica]|uniref:Ribonucleases P/MRP protein subunit pop1 n=1 Tax=Coemansia asiatica TaxID=1052880 RepID=A0A9W8CIG0_9FUNG|nr:Ribonucleases P/MRP protein subunit pop1 [Coemansia asiatica]